MQRKHALLSDVVWCFYRRPLGDVQVGAVHTEALPDGHVQQLRQAGGLHQDVRATRLHNGRLQGHDAQIPLLCQGSCKWPFAIVWTVINIAKFFLLTPHR